MSNFEYVQARHGSGWDRKREAHADQSGELRCGIGVACYFHGSSLGGEGDDYANCTLSIEKDYGVPLTSGLTDYGQGSRTGFTLVAAETLGLGGTAPAIGNAMFQATGQQHRPLSLTLERVPLGYDQQHEKGMAQCRRALGYERELRWQLR